MCLPPGEVYVLHAHCILIIKQRFTQKRRVLFSRARRRLPELARGSHTAPRLSPPCVPHARGGKDESLSPRNPPRCLTPTRCSAEPPAELSPAELRMSRAEEAAWGRAGGSEASRWGGGRPPGCPRALCHSSAASSASPLRPAGSELPSAPTAGPRESAPACCQSPSLTVTGFARLARVPPLGLPQERGWRSNAGRGTGFRGGRGGAQRRSSRAAERGGRAEGACHGHAVGQSPARP